MHPIADRWAKSHRIIAYKMTEALNAGFITYTCQLHLGGSVLASQLKGWEPYAVQYHANYDDSCVVTLTWRKPCPS